VVPSAGQIKPLARAGMELLHHLRYPDPEEVII